MENRKRPGFPQAEPPLLTRRPPPSQNPTVPTPRLPPPVGWLFSSGMGGIFQPESVAFFAGIRTLGRSVIAGRI